MTGPNPADKKNGLPEVRRCAASSSSTPLGLDDLLTLIAEMKKGSSYSSNNTAVLLPSRKEATGEEKAEERARPTISSSSSQTNQRRSTTQSCLKRAMDHCSSSSSSRREEDLLIVAEQRTLVAEQRATIVELRDEVESLRKSRVELRKRADDLRDKNVHMAKRLARRGSDDMSSVGDDSSVGSVGSSHSQRQRRVRGGTDAYGRRVDDLRSANDALERLVHTKDEELDSLGEAVKVSEELISILRREVLSLKKKNADDEVKLCSKLSKSERKNKATKRSLEHCVKEMDDVKAQLEALRNARRLENEAKQNKSVEEHGEIKSLQRELEERDACARDAIADLEMKLRDAKGELKKFRTFQSSAAAAVARDLEECRRSSEKAFSLLRTRLEEAEGRARALEMKNATLGDLLSLGEQLATPPGEGTRTAPRCSSSRPSASRRSSAISSSSRRSNGPLETWASSSWPRPMASVSLPLPSETRHPVGQAMAPLLLAMLQSSNSSIQSESGVAR
uniref:Uncharacterized protein n=1 Tax=Odontella aurita TaxID=265563 RepID=A0A7S4N6A3_9STRA|mmetsp:Transcript_48784/g.146991  ORF Transcript_48784/g.146991 Transcript_48784/m.146991 type:complete len:508 (+) Transcript_48784:277-1800(+)